MANIPKRIAIVYDRVNKWGGAERLLLALHSLFPSADLFTSVFNPTTAPWAKVFPNVYTSFINSIPFFRNHHELVPFLMPICFEQFDFSTYDLVISVTSESAKGILTKPKTRHICYCLTPTRYLYSHKQHYLSSAVHKLLAKYIHYWDQIACHRPDSYISISKTVANRIKKYYGLDSKVVYPGVDTSFFKPARRSGTKKYFLVVSRLVSYKNIDQIIEVFNNTNHKLVIVGNGSNENYLKSISSENITFLNGVSDDYLLNLYQNCQAVIFFHEEDLGLVPLEAMACGKPVIALNLGGARETIIHYKTGVLVNNKSELLAALNNFSPEKYDSKFISNHANKYSLKAFSANFINMLNSKAP